MNRPRKSDRHLPACVYHRHGAYYHVSHGKWRLIGHDLASALHEYARIAAQPRSGMSELIDQALPFVLRDRDGKPLRSVTQKQYTRAADELKRALAEFTPAQLKRGDVQVMMDGYSDRRAIANRMLVVLHKTFEYACKRGLADGNPCVRQPRFRMKRDRLITPAEYKAIHAKLSPRNQCVMDLCFLTGQRVGDILSLKRAQLQADGIHFVQQKTGARLVVAWTQELRDVVARAKSLTGTVVRQTLLSSRDGGPPQYSHVWRAFSAAATAAGVADFRIHDLRALAATTADAEGISAQKLLGHKSARTTESYLRDKRVPVVKGPRQA